MNNESDIVAQMAHVPVLQEPAELKQEKPEPEVVAMESVNQSHSDEIHGHAPGTDTKRVGWKQWEDDKLRMLVSKYGEKSWTAISKEFPGREPKQCRERWVNHLVPGVRKGRLTEDEWAQVLNLQTVHGNKWSEIARYLPGRTPNQIKNYWHSQVRSAKELSKDFDTPMILGPHGVPIPIPIGPPGTPGSVSNEGFKTPAPKKRKRVNDASSDSETPAKVPKPSDEPIQVEMPMMPPFPAFPGIPRLDVTTLPPLVQIVAPSDGSQNFGADNQSQGDLPFVLPLLQSLPDPSTVSS